MLPLSLLRNMSTLAWTSTISMTAITIIVITICISAPFKSNDIDHSQSIPFIRIGFFEGVGTMSFAFVCHHNSFIIYNSLKNATKERWKIVSNGSVSLSVSLSLLLSIIAYLSFRDEIESDCLNNFSFNDVAISISRVLLAITMVLTYPMEQFVSRHLVMEILQSLFHKFDAKDVELKNRKYLIHFYGTTFILWSSSLLIGATAKDLGIALSLVGAIAGSGLGYIMPALVIIKTNDLWINKRHVWYTKKFIISMFMLIFGVLALIAGTTFSILSAF